MDKTIFRIYTKIIIFSFIILYSLSIFSQKVGINIVDPQGIFHVDSKGNNNDSTTPTSLKHKDDFIITSDGNIGIGTIKPTTKLHIVSDKDPLQIEGLKNGNFLKHNYLILDKNNLVKKTPSLENLSLLIPFPAIFTLHTDQLDFLNKVGNGFSQIVPMKETKNAIDGLIFDEKKSTLTLPKGTYQFSFNYQASHSEIKNNCFISSYFVDFPSNSKTTERINNTSRHLFSLESSLHYGSINYTVTLPTTTSWQIRLGRGDSGNCHDRDMILKKDLTQLIIYKIG